MFVFRIGFVGLIVSTICLSHACAQEPQPVGRVVLKKGLIRISLSVPGDPINYRGTRFDHSGMIQRIQWGDHELCERWHLGPSNPDANDDVTGPCEEFGNAAPLGYIPNTPGSTRIRELLRKKDVTMPTTAERLGVSTSQIRNIKFKRSSPNFAATCVST